MTAEVPYSVSGTLPLQLEPRPGDPEGARVDALCKWLREHPDAVQDRLARHGALRFRGFDVHGPEDFEQVARAVDDELKSHYLGTSPRDAVTGHVFRASELPDYFPIPQHCEMSFCARPPRRVFFACLEPPAPGSGETPLCDFRAVWRDLDPAVRERFLAGGIRIVRNYASPHGGREDDPTMLKTWPAMFQTTDRAEVEAQCRAEGFSVEWLEGDALRIVSTQPVTRDHPVTGERVWHNHLTTFHLTTAAAEYARIAALRPTERHQGLRRMALALEERLRERSAEDQSMHVTYVDGSEIPEADVEAVRDAVWRHMVIDPWERGDVVAIDNHSISHGRLPYEGPREIVVCWA